MGGNEEWAEPGEPMPNGLLPGSDPVMGVLDTERWLKAEERTAELIACIQPNSPSEERRNAVADYVQRLIMKCFPCQVCTFGSVPLKTYLPDGDIDLTAFSNNLNLKDTWANQVRDMLENEEKNENAEFHVKEVQYIQAEVKIIKCLVENIVVDISFNQVGGLCTLCFLDEVDNLISQNHLFKRSIILIKAWCYYESRILGAHHGLISTYALETLVLYIFHLFNNSFHGPLEVLYRFLEFFSNFDWDNFCVSLWGPVPISALPDITAEPPRKDSGELLLSKLFLDACSSVYAVFPAGQENNGQAFVSKHFNVIDPLRVNNNLGRSVSKGNFFRIRSAFAFGAKKLRKLLDCPKEHLFFEVNQFFMNTWERHGSGHRPDAPELDSRNLRSPTPSSSQEFDNCSIDTSVKKVNTSSSANGVEAHGVSSRHGKYSAKMAPITAESSAAAHTHSSKSQINLLVSDHIVKNPVDQVVHDDEDQKNLKAFARTQSSPELTDACGDLLSQPLRSKAETSNLHATNARLDTSNRRRTIGSESLASHSSRSSAEDVPSHQSFDAFNEEFPSSSGAQMTQLEEQDIVNMMASASLQGFNGQVHAPYNLASGHLSFPIPPSFLPSMGYAQRNMQGFLPTNIPLIDPSFSNMQFPQGLVSPQLTHYFPSHGLNTPSEGSVDQISDNLVNSGEADSDFWLERDVGPSGGYDPENGNSELHQSDDKPSGFSSGSKYVPPFRARLSGSATRLQQKHSRGKEGSARENIDSFQNHDVRSSEEERSTSSRFSSSTHDNSVRNRTSSDNSWKGSVKMHKSLKEKRGKKVVSTNIVADHGKEKITSELVTNQAEDYDQEWGSSLDIGKEMVASLQVPRHHMSGFELAQTSGSGSGIPFAPMLIRPGSRQTMGDNSGLITFYPTGPPIPFLTMLPVYNVPPETGASDASSSHFGGDETSGNSESGQSFSLEGFEHPENSNSPSYLRGATTTETSEQKSDILNSDFASHWQNLQFGRICQNSRNHGPLLYQSPVMIPPVHLQGGFPYDNPGAPLSPNTNSSSQLMTSYGQRLVPVAPLQPVPRRPPNMYQGYMDDMPRYRSGTGTYLPNPISLGERNSSSARRGNYNHDRNDNYGDRDGNWNGYHRSRGAGRSNNRSQNDKSSTRSDRMASAENRSDRPWNSYRNDSIPSYQSQNGPLRFNSTQNGPQNVAHGIYPLAATNPNGVINGPSGAQAMMMYPLDHNAIYGSHGEQLEFGSLGPVAFPGINEQSQLNAGTRARAFEDHRLRASSGRGSSPDQPSSSPHHRREHLPRDRR